MTSCDPPWSCDSSLHAVLASPALQRDSRHDDSRKKLHMEILGAGRRAREEKSSPRLPQLVTNYVAAVKVQLSYLVDPAYYRAPVLTIGAFSRRRSTVVQLCASFFFLVLLLLIDVSVRQSERGSGIYSVVRSPEAEVRASNDTRSHRHTIFSPRLRACLIGASLAAAKQSHCPCRSSRPSQSAQRTCTSPRLHAKISCTPR